VLEIKAFNLCVCLDSCVKGNEDVMVLRAKFSCKSLHWGFFVGRYLVECN